MPKITLGYWKIRGLAQVARLLLAYTEIDFEDVHYTDPDKWFKEDKFGLGFDFPNLPYIVDGDFKLTESIAIYKYIINKSGKTDLLGKNSRDQGKIEAILGTLKDAMKDLMGLMFNPDH